MASAFSHAIVASAIGSVPPRCVMTWRLLILGVACSVLPDLDAIGFRNGVAYASFWGHRGLTHSLFFALLLSALLTAVFFIRKPPAIASVSFLYLFMCTASHGVLDAMTNGGLGVAFFSPFITTRYFFPFRPIVVSPISISRFFEGRGVEVLASEFKWLWLPSFALMSLSYMLRRVRLRENEA
jgi:inner membrane protein